MDSRNKLDIHFSIPVNLPKIAFNWRSWLPTRGNVLFTLVVIVSLFWAQSVKAFPWSNQLAQNGTSIGTWPYQGRLADSAGNPITNSLSMTFRIYSAPSGGTVLWEEKWDGANSVQVSDGLFNIMLGSITPLPQSLVTSNTSLWLGIEVGTDTEMTPRVQLGSVPFAAQALTVPDGSISSLKLADGAITNAKIMDNAITTTKLADGAVTQAKLGADINLVPPDGSITRSKLANDIKLTVVDNGYNYSSTSNQGWTLSQGSGPRYFRVHATFGKTFVTPPGVSLGLMSIDELNTTNTRVNVYAENITKDGFDIVYLAWGDSIMYGVGASWVAVGY
jgi:hypothetical protein